MKSFLGPIPQYKRLCSMPQTLRHAKIVAAALALAFLPLRAVFSQSASLPLLSAGLVVNEAKHGNSSTYTVFHPELPEVVLRAKECASTIEMCRFELIILAESEISVGEVVHRDIVEAKYWAASQQVFDKLCKTEVIERHLEIRDSNTSWTISSVSTTYDKFSCPFDEGHLTGLSLSNWTPFGKTYSIEIAEKSSELKWSDVE